ncbi:metallophosphoesterase family protein [Cohnella lubricantis]|uniref:Phosphoesterase n=1 Tax=Cohnella lubricantis TaxID=2163172 RepID=A0A841T9B6_9BACL|nr:metallophosphoesterase family protein [Cohnella lubricantis]MBB6676615.1 metallophosphoesterase [Cohnella lubricantis]MBP2117374.1 putative phosphoesterase [Cohnella lubricantis]
MLIGVVSDTHMPRMAKALPPTLDDAFRKADRILHAGDWTDLRVLDAFEKLAPVDGVAGNNDGAEIVRRFGWRKIIRVGGVSIGLVHGHGSGARTAAATEERVIRAFKDDDIDCIVFGHSHVPVLKEVNGVLVFNPGSPTDKRRQPRYSFGLLEITDGRIKARHLFYDKKG